jgi:aromatic ring-opening dioxygenase LigB subunit
VRRLRVRGVGAIVPHAPLLLPQLRGPETAAAATRVTSAVEALELGDADVVVVVSPHGTASGVYAEVSGTLDAFGVPGIEVRRATDGDLDAALARRWERPLLPDVVDYGVVVPLLLAGEADAPVVAVSLQENGDAVADGRALLSALLDATEGLDVAVVASANTSIALSARAPLTLRPEAREVEDRLLELLPSDAGAASELASDLARSGGSCGAGPLTVFGELCRGATTNVLAHEEPVGIGYLVAKAEARVS